MLKPRWSWRYHLAADTHDVLILQTPTLDVYSTPRGSSQYVVVQEHPKSDRPHTYTRFYVRKNGVLYFVDDDVTLTPHDMCLIYEYIANNT